MTTTTSSSTAAFCQNCGRPLTEAEVRNVGGRIFCVPCATAGMNPGYAPAPGAAPGAAPGYPPPYGPPTLPHAPSPVVAGLLGFIPGVGAMYNGQFVKGLVHVVVFVALISASTHFGLFGLLIAAWEFYQVFDAVQTASAIRMGLPLPDPLGLNNIGAKLGIGHAGNAWGPPPAGGYPPPPSAPYPGPTVPGADSTGAPQAPQAQSPYGSQPYAAQPPAAQTPFDTPASSLVPYTPQESSEPSAAYSGAPFSSSSYSAFPGAAPGVPGEAPPAGYTPYAPVPPRKSLPIGAFILIGLGALFLLNAFDVFDMDWIGHGWPLILIGIGGWLLYRNTRNNNGGTR